MKRLGFRFTIRGFMIWTVVLAAGLAYLVAADRKGQASRCGHPLIFAVWVLILAAFAFGVIRMLIFAIRHPS